VSPQLTFRHIWPWYWALLITNALDLLFTYTAAERGVPELNVILQPILLTPWPTVLKFSSLALLGAGLALVTPVGRRPARVLRLVRATAYIYLGLICFHILGLVLIG
jgi:hypothetical protein